MDSKEMALYAALIIAIAALALAVLTMSETKTGLFAEATIPA